MIGLRIGWARVPARMDEHRAAVALLHTLAPETGSLAIDRSGRKPKFADSPLHFSLSHSGGCVLAAVAEGEVGCDLQRHRPVSDRLAKKALSPAEYGQYQALPAGDREEFFFSRWTMKESYMKFTGEGLRLAPGRIDLAHSEGDALPGSGTVFYRYCPEKGLSAALCLAVGAPRPELQFFTL